MRLRLPATSANLGPAFDSAALALNLHLEIEAELAASFSVAAAGVDTDGCARVERNLVLDTYRETLSGNGCDVQPLHLDVKNAIPLGMGLGSSAAARLTGLALASHFGKLGWDDARMVNEASALEGHADNAAACWLGGFVIASIAECSVTTARFEPPPKWHAVVVVPGASLATSKARAVLPQRVSRADAIANIQCVSLLTAAFAQGRGDFLREAMADRLHQPYRATMCPLLPRLLPLAGQARVMGVALSGAGPSVLLLVETAEAANDKDLHQAIADRAGEAVNILPLGLATEGATVNF